MQQVAVIGSGSWGTALAIHLSMSGHDVRLWARDPGLVAEMATRRANPVYLPDVTFPERLQPT
ncbi:MAG TPA: 2-dehydropantoate 2-reductase N-terminal domain-containing protein, partial [Vicinamibacterales bacterium]|nr:2-dehydropantoate 2-reductase N-terminal domain-containing protein [Vicinamibacterales bacterium]